MLGKVPTKNKNDFYLVRLIQEGLSAFMEADIIVDYSLANIENIRLSQQHDILIPKLVYIPSIPFEYEPFYGKHSRNSVTSCVLVFDDGSRRGIILHKLNGLVPVKNAYFNSLLDLQTLWDDSKILVNVHQTDQHHTLEEFRILPALSRGVIVVSEWVPLAHIMPFHEYIIFCDYDDIPKTVKHVYDNYESYRDRFFGNSSKLGEIFAKMKTDAMNDLERVVLKLLNASTMSANSNKIIHGFTPFSVIDDKNSPIRLVNISKLSYD